MFGRLTKIIISISFVLFLMIFFLDQAIYPEIIQSNDFFGYIELGRNIFNKLNFVVRWQLDNPIIYPPLFPILIYLLTFFTKDPLVSIQYLNAFSASFCLIPLFLVTKKLLNNISAFLVTIFMIYFFALNKPCYFFYSDYFFTFLTITVFWLIWDVLTRENQKAASFVFAGILISLAYLTKYHGMIYCLWAIILIFYFFRQNHYSLKTILKKISFLVLGFLPLFIIYHTLLYINGSHEQACDAGTVLFIDGIKGEREHQLYVLNPEGTEFNHLSDCRTFTPLSFCLKYPELVLRRYTKGSKIAFKIMTKRVFPFVFAKAKNFYIMIQYILLILILIAQIYHKYHFKIIYVSLFASTVLFLPLYPISERYLMPFMPFYFILWLSGVNGLYNLFKHNRKVKNLKHIVKLLVIISTIILVYNYSLKFYTHTFRYGQRKRCPYKEYLKAASWIKNDSKNKTERSKIMSRKTSFAYLANAHFIALPYENSWEKIIHFALMKNVDYIILDKKVLFAQRKDQWRYLTETIPQNSHILLAYKDTDEGNVIIIFKLRP
jgi:4-amino-4-deoxy-L-arabinose transferase-like glycosyltransferase